MKQRRFLIVEVSPWRKEYRRYGYTNWEKYESISELKTQLLEEMGNKMQEYINSAPSEKERKRRIKSAVPYTDVEFDCVDGFGGIMF